MPAIMLMGCTQHTSNDARLIQKAKQLHTQIVTIDSHTDTPLWLLQDNFSIVDGDANGRAKATLTQMQQGGLDAAFYAVFISQGQRTPHHYQEAYRKAMTIFDSVHTSILRHSDYAQIALKVEDAQELKQQGRRAIYLGVENGYPIGKDLHRIDSMYYRGARYLTLCHTSNNDICDSSTDIRGPEHNGLSPFGREVVQRLNSLGMMIDVSHISDSAFYQTLRLSKVPVIASHSNARAICDNPRNLTDEMLKALKVNGGVVQMCLLSSYVKPDEPNPSRDSAFVALREKYGHMEDMDEKTHQQLIADWYAIDDNFPPTLPTVSDLVDHIDHIVQLIGIDHVGIGSDFDGGGALADCFDAGEMYHITAELLCRGYTQSDIQKIWGENLLRVFRQVEQYAQREIAPV